MVSRPDLVSDAQAFLDRDEVHRKITKQVRDGPRTALEVASDIEEQVHLVAALLRELEDHYVVGAVNTESAAPAYTVTPFGKRILDRT